MDTDKSWLMIGANSAIASAVMQLVEPDRIVAISREALQAVDASQQPLAGRVRSIMCDHQEASIEGVIDTLRQEQWSFDRVLIAVGALHDAQLGLPEKRLEHIDRAGLAHQFEVNSIIPMLWLAKLLPLLAQGRVCQIVVMSARVGSIGDNRLGGWYGYRASKAALNMLVKTASIEYAKRAPNVRFLLFHPGTTASPLSAPFVGTAPSAKVMAPEFVAARLLQCLAGQDHSEQLQYLDWQGEPIAW